jgi:nicotinamidase-related amidase
MFDSKVAFDLTGFEGSGAYWLSLYKPYMKGKNILVTSHHNFFGPESNYLALQLRKKGFDKVIPAGMSGNLFVEFHMRGLIEERFEVAILWDTTGSAILHGMNGVEAVMVNYKMIAHKAYTFYGRLRFFF